MSVRVEERPWLAITDSPLSVDSDEAHWIERARAGDQAGFRWLLDRYRERVIRLAAHVLRRPEEAEDVAQEAFVRAFQAIGTFRGESRFYTWLYHIVVRLCLDRKNCARWSREVAFDSSSAETHQFADASETRMLAAALLDRLTPPIRAALVLRELEGLEYEEIAEVLGIPVGTVRSRLSAARTQFREMWSEAMREAENV